MMPPAPQAQSKGFKTQNIKYLSLQTNDRTVSQLHPSSRKSVEAKSTTKAVPNYRTPKAVASSSYLRAINALHTTRPFRKLRYRPCSTVMANGAGCQSTVTPRIDCAPSTETAMPKTQL